MPSVSFLNLTIKYNRIYNNKKYDDEGKVIRGVSREKVLISWEYF